MKIVINDCYGGFRLSNDELKRIGYTDKRYYDIPRNDRGLVAAVELGVIKNEPGDSRKLKVVEIPDKATDWSIIEYDGAEYVIFVVDGKLDTAE